MNKRRIALTMCLGLLSEVANKLVPLLTLHVVASRLGPKAFGHAQFSLWLIDWGILLTTFGFMQAGPMLVRRSIDCRDESLAVGRVLCSKLALAVISCIGLIGLVRTGSVYDPYQLAVFASLGVILTTALDCSWLLLAKQKMAVWSILTVTAKFLSLAAIFHFIRTPNDSVTFVVITNGANGLISLASFLYAMKLVGISRPTIKQVFETVSQATPFALGLVFLLVIERFDLSLVEHGFGDQATGLYSAASRLVGSLTPIIAMVSNIFYSEMLAHHAHREITRHLEASLFWVITVIAPIIVGIWFVNNDILQLVYGQDYLPAHTILNLLAAGMVFYAAITIFGFQLLVLKGTWKPLVMALIVGAVIGVALGAILTKTHGLNGIAVSAVVARGIASFIIVMIAIRLWHLDVLGLTRITLKALVPTLGMGLVVTVQRNMVAAGSIDFYKTVGFSVVSYGIIFGLLNFGEVRKIVEAFMKKNIN